MANNAPADLTAAQHRALVDILTHHETYAEIVELKYPGTIHNYGPPFQESLERSNVPLLQNLFSRYVLKLPGLRDVSPDFWKVQVTDLIDELSQAELSESYDKGLLGIRKTLATAGSALIEYPARGSLGGFAKADKPAPTDKQYDVKNPNDVLQAWQDCLQAAVYDDFIDDMFARAAETDDLEEHPSLVRGVHEFLVVNVASMMHYTLILSPEGPAMIRLMDSVHKLIPYTMVRQALKIGNVASMLSGVMNIVLAKVSLASVSNWMGLSRGADEGMNLMQQIISQVLGWEKRELKNRASKIEKDKNGPPKAVLEELRDWVNNRERSEHDECRRQSQQQGKSIVAIILSLSSVDDELSESQHAQAQDYLFLNLSVRDRQEIMKVLCKRNPDHLTTAVRTAVDAYTPMIRHVHQAVNLSDSLWDLEQFITDMLKISKPQGKKGQETIPKVEDFVDLLHRHQKNLHKFLHQISKNGKEVTSWWRDWCSYAVKEFRADEQSTTKDTVLPAKLTTSAGIQSAMQSLFAELKPEDRAAVEKELKAHGKYLDDLYASSAARISAVITRSKSTPYGPGAYLSRWQQLMDDTAITPATLSGPVRYGSDHSVKEAGHKDLEGNDIGYADEAEAQKIVEGQTPPAPSVESTIRLFGARFRQVLAGH